jgi:hypothetical protein
VFSGVNSVEHPQPELHRSLVTGALDVTGYYQVGFLDNSDIPQPLKRVNPGVSDHAPHQPAKLRWP